MMQSSDRAYIVVDAARENSSMKDYIRSSVATSDPRVYQLPSLSEVSTWHDGLRIGSLPGLLLELQQCHFHQVLDLSVVPSARILAVQTRRADLYGPALQLCHFEVGRFLAERLLDHFPFLGLLEQKQFDHVQGVTFEGPITSAMVVIVALMRGGEPMARGIFDRFPRAQFVHYNGDPKSSLGFIDKLKNDHPVHIFLVDSVVNRGDTIRRVLDDMKERLGCTGSRSAATYVLTGVMHEAASACLPKEFPRTRFLALRISTNQFTGKGGTDTGNRLFGTF